LWITGLQLWYDARDVLNTGTNPANGTALTTWFDKSGNGRNATGVNGPTYSNTQVYFNGTTQAFTTSYTAVNTTETVIVVATMNASGTGDILGSSATGGREVYGDQTAFSVSLKKYGGATINPGSVIINTNVSFIWVNTFTTTSSSTYNAGSNDSIGVNGGAYSGAGVTYLGRSGTASNYLNGRIREVLIYNSVLSTTNRQIIEGWLAWAFDPNGTANIVSRLPGAHPYKTAGP
jgi:hypothetical protein